MTTPFHFLGSIYASLLISRGVHCLFDVLGDAANTVGHVAEALLGLIPLNMLQQVAFVAGREHRYPGFFIYGVLHTTMNDVI